MLDDFLWPDDGYIEVPESVLHALALFAMEIVFLLLGIGSSALQFENTMAFAAALYDAMVQSA